MSSRAYLVDLLHSIGEKTALCDHIEEQIVAGENVEENTRILESTLALRREQMSDLLSKGERPNPYYHCAVKHAIKAFTLDSEVYEATLEEKDLDNLRRSADILAMALSKYLGLEFQVCGRCLAELLLEKEYDS